MLAEVVYLRKSWHCRPLLSRPKCSCSHYLGPEKSLFACERRYLIWLWKASYFCFFPPWFGPGSCGRIPCGQQALPCVSATAGASMLRCLHRSPEDDWVVPPPLLSSRAYRQWSWLLTTLLLRALPRPLQSGSSRGDLEAAPFASRDFEQMFWFVWT